MKEAKVYKIRVTGEVLETPNRFHPGLHPPSSEGGALFEITCRTIHSRFLFRPTHRFNEIVVGVLARAKRRYGVEISAFCCLSNHFHILARVDDSQQLSRFMCYVCSKLAREVGP